MRREVARLLMETRWEVVRGLPLFGEWQRREEFEGMVSDGVRTDVEMDPVLDLWKTPYIPFSLNGNTELRSTFLWPLDLRFVEVIEDRTDEGNGGLVSFRAAEMAPA